MLISHNECNDYQPREVQHLPFRRPQGPRDRPAQAGVYGEREDGGVGELDGRNGQIEEL